MHASSRASGSAGSPRRAHLAGLSRKPVAPGVWSLPAGRYAQARFELEPHQYEAAWNTVYGGWLPESGYQPADGLPFERNLNDPNDHPQGKHLVEICVPVKPVISLITCWSLMFICVIAFCIRRM